MDFKLREEYNKNKKKRDKLVTEAAHAWFSENVILINEQIDRRTVQRLIDSITKFDDAFGPFKDKIPALASQLDTAEAGLEKVITGKANEKKASELLQRLNFIQSSLSRFFSKDLPILLRSHLFSTAKDNGAVRLDVLQPKSGQRYNPTAVRDALKHALEPSKDDMKFLRKIYRSKVPLIDAGAISSQMLQLSYNELEQLSSMGAVPMVVTPEPAPNPEQELEGAPKEAVIPVAKESVARTQKKDQLVLESHNVLLEINQANMQKLADIIEQLENSFNISGLEKVNASLKNVISRARKELASNQWMQGKAAKQLLGFYNLMDNLNQQWPSIQQLFADGQLDTNDQIDLKKLLISATKDSVFARLAKAVKLSSPHAPGLDPNSLVNGIIAAVGAEGGIQAVTSLFSKSQGMPGTDTQGEPKLGGQTTPPAGTAQSAETTGAATPDQTGDTTTTQSSGPGASLDNETIAKDVAQKARLNPNDTGNIEALMNTITNSGYKIVQA